MGFKALLQEGENPGPAPAASLGACLRAVTPDGSFSDTGWVTHTGVTPGVEVGRQTLDGVKFLGSEIISILSLSLHIKKQVKAV